MRKLNAEEFAKNPMYQVILIFGVALTLALLELLANTIGLMDSKPNSPWIIMTAFVLFFAIANSILSLRVENLNRYWGISIMSFTALMACAAVAATLISGISIDEAGSFRWLFMVLTFGYLVFLSIARMIRQIVEYAMNQDDEFESK